MANEHQNSFYIYHHEQLESNILTIENAVKAYYQNFNIGYSVKTNFVPGICKDAVRLGAYAEVVSPMELEIARRIGVPYDRIIYNGPIKDRPTLHACIKHQSILNVDHYEEVLLIQNILENNPELKARLGVRLNLPLDDKFNSRFGFEIDSNDLKRFLNSVNQNNQIELVGIHHHSTRPDKSLNSYKQRLEQMIHFYLKHKAFFNLEYIDIGGGFYGPMDENIRHQFPGEIPSASDYGKVLGQTMAQYFPNSEVKLLAEPGLAMVVNVLDFYCEVEYVKKVGDRNIAGVSGSVFNVKPSGHKKDLTAYLISKNPPGGDTYHYIVAGFTCLEHDLMHERFEGRVSKGDFIVFKNVGAYTLVFNPLFIKPPPPIISSDGSRVLKYSETFNNTFHSYNFA